MFYCLFFVLYVYSVRIYSQGGYFQIRRSGGLGPHIRFGGKIWGKVRPSSQNKRKNLGSSVTKRHKSWEKVPTNFGVISEIQRAKVGVFVIYNFGGKIWGSKKNFRGKIWGQAPRPPNMEVPPWEFTSGVKDVTFVLTYISFIIENGLLDRIRGWFYYVFRKPSFHMIVDDRYDHWDHLDR